MHRPFLQQAPTTPDLPEPDIFPLRPFGGVKGVRTVVKGRRRQAPRKSLDYDEQQAMLKLQQAGLETRLKAQTPLPVERVKTRVGGGLRVKTRARVADPVQVQTKTETVQPDAETRQGDSQTTVKGRDPDQVKNRYSRSREAAGTTVPRTRGREAKT